MFADHEWSGCNTRSVYGIYIWTAGHRENPKNVSEWLWVTNNVHVDQHEIKNSRFNNTPMGYTNWWIPYQPDNADGGKEACVNMLKKYDYKWNDEACNKKYCYVCEDRKFPI